MKIMISVLALIVAIPVLQAQEFNVPKNYILVKAEDYAPYEQDVLNSIDWILTTPNDEQLSKRNEINNFLLKWIAGSPTVSIEIHPEIVTFMGSSPDLLMMFLGGWTKYSIETKEYKDKVGGNIAGLEAVINFYTQNELPKDKNVEDLIKLHKNGKLKGYIERRQQKK